MPGKINEPGMLPSGTRVRVKMRDPELLLLYVGTVLGHDRTLLAVRVEATRYPGGDSQEDPLATHEHLLIPWKSIQHVSVVEEVAA